LEAIAQQLSVLSETILQEYQPMKLGDKRLNIMIHSQLEGLHASISKKLLKLPLHVAEVDQLYQKHQKLLSDICKLENLEIDCNNLIILISDMHLQNTAVLTENLYLLQSKYNAFLQFFQQSYKS
jgi:hypothetical protein